MPNANLQHHRQNTASVAGHGETGQIMTGACTINWLLCSISKSPRLNWAMRLGSR